jgi:predicted ATPase/DNA-binding SARP family transcriptional activator
MPRLRTRKDAWLLSLLILHHPRPLDRNWLAASLWPDSPEPTALVNLRMSLKSLRRAMGAESYRLLAPTPRTLALDLTGAEVDLHLFDAAIARAEDAARGTADPVSLAAAVALYRGPFLDGCVEPWALHERSTREDACLHALERLASRAASEGEPALAERYLRRAIDIDPVRESASRALMRALADSGHSAAAFLVFHELRRRLHGELHAEPDPETVRLFEQIRESVRRRNDPVTARTAEERRRAPHRLPTAPSGLVGRERELSMAGTLLRRPDVRLVTLVGPGGVGKTRLALQIAEELSIAFEDGACFVSLAAIRDASLVASTIAGALGLPARGDPSPREAVIGYLREREILLLLDNFEQILRAADLLAELLAAAPRLKLLVTSRAVLRLRGEHEFAVQPLALPDRAIAPSIETLSQYAAVVLFVERVQAVSPRFSVTNENAPAVAEICWRLDGLPLAIELAAARMKLFTPEELLARLESRLGLLVGGARDLPSRQRTLRDTVAWSHDLLEERERRLFRHLAVFHGGFTLEAVEALCGRADVLEELASLIDQSLVQAVDGTSGSRFGMLETVREYALETLTAEGEAPAARRRHAEVCLDLAEEAAPEILGPDAALWVQRLDADHDNVRAALEWALETGEAELGLRLGIAMARFWRLQGHLPEGRDRLNRLLALPGASGKTALRAQAVETAGGIIERLGDLDKARGYYEESLGIFREVEDREGIASSLGGLASCATLRDQYEAAEPLLGESLAIRRELGDPVGIAGALHALAGLSYRQGEFATAARLYDESIETFRKLSRRPSLTIALSNRGLVAEFQADPEGVGRSFGEALALAREIGDIENIAFSLLHLGGLAFEQGDLEAARTSCEECLTLCRQDQNKGRLLWPLNPLARVAFLQGNEERSETLWRECLSLGRELRADHAVGEALAGLGDLAIERGDPSAARRHYLEGLTALRRVRDVEALRRKGPRVGIAHCLTGLARVADALEDRERAARLLGAAERLRLDLGASLPSPELPRHERLVQRVRAVLGDEAFAAAWAEGGAAALEELLAEAMADEGPARQG